MSTLSRRLHKLAGLPNSDKLYLARGFAVVVAVRLGLSLAGYNKLRRLMPNADQIAPADVARRVGWSVSRAARLVPRASCFTQALAAQFMLARLGYQSDIRVGVRQDASGRIGAHAWLLSANQVILGGNPAELQHYAPLVDLSPRSP